MNANRLLFYSRLFACICGCLLALPACAQTPRAPRTVLLLCNGLTVDDLDSPAMPRLRALARSGQAALMNTAVSGPKTDAAALQAILLGRIEPVRPGGLSFHASDSSFSLLHAAGRKELEARLAALPAGLGRILVVSPRPPLDAHGNWQPRLTPVILADPGIKSGLLTSATTRTPGLIANLDIAPTLYAWNGKPVPPEMTGHPLAFAPSADPLADLRRLDRIVTTNARALVPVFLTLGLLAALIVFGGLLALILRPALTPGFAFGILFLMNMPLALLLMPIFDFRLTTFDFMGCTLGLMLACALAEIFLARLLRHPVTLSPCHLVTALTGAVILADACFGQTLNKFSLLSAFQLTGIRFYGIGNEYLGVLIGLTLLGAFLARVSAPVAAGIFLAETFIVSFPGLGANAGGLVAAAAAFGIAWTVLRGRRATWRGAVLWTLLGLAATFGFAVLDSLLSGGGASHAGDALRTAGAAGWGYLRDIAARKLLMNARIFLHPGTLAALAGIAALTLLLRARGQAYVTNLMARHPDWARGLPAVGWGAAAAFLFKDSGTVAALFLIGVYFAAGFYFLFRDPPA
jgi:hypothetical protein